MHKHVCDESPRFKSSVGCEEQLRRYGTVRHQRICFDVIRQERGDLQVNTLTTNGFISSLYFLYYKLILLRRVLLIILYLLDRVSL